jgi:hypothetical protein
MLEAELIGFEYNAISRSIILSVDSKEEYLSLILNKILTKQLSLGYEHLIYRLEFTNVSDYTSNNCHSDYNENYFFSSNIGHIQLETVEVSESKEGLKCGLYFFSSFGSREFICSSIQFEQFVVIEDNGILIDREREKKFEFDTLK